MHVSKGATTEFRGLSDDATVTITGDGTTMQEVGNVEFSTKNDSATATLILKRVDIDKITRNNTGATAFTIKSEGSAESRIDSLDLDSSSTSAGTLETLTVEASGVFTAKLDAADVSATPGSI